MSETESYARLHEGGRVICSSSPNGRYIISCGADGSLNKYNFNDLANPKALDDSNQTHDEPFHDISFSSSGDYFATACEDGEISLFMFPTCASQSTPISFDTPAVAAQFQPKKNSFLLAAASESGTIRIVNALSPASGDITDWIGDAAGVRSMTWDPSGDLLSVAGCDGGLTVFKFEAPGQSPAPVHSSTKVFPKIRPANGAQRLVMDFHPNGTLLALPGKMDVVVLNVASWEEQYNLPGHHLHNISIVKFSPDGGYLASGDVSGGLVVWKLAEDCSPEPIANMKLFIPDQENAAKIMSQFASEPLGVGSIIWSADCSTIVVGDCAGNMFEWKPALLPKLGSQTSDASNSASCPATLPYSMGSQESNASESATVARETSTTQAKAKSPSEDAELDGFDIDEPEDDFSLVGTSRTIIRRKRSTFQSDSDSDDEKASQEHPTSGFFKDVIVAEANEDNSAVENVKDETSQNPAEITSMFDGMDLSYEDLEAAEQTAQASQLQPVSAVPEDADVVMDDIEDADGMVVDDVGDDPLGRVLMDDAQPIVHEQMDDEQIRAVFLRHTPFQSGNTPFDESRQRYLTWNEIGAVIGREDSTATTFGSFAVEIDFCDKSLYPRAVRFRENAAFDVAALGSDSLFLGSRGGDLVNGSVPMLRFHGFQTNWAGKVEWSHVLPESESVCCVGVTSDYAAAATSMNYLRLFSKGGMQVAILSLPGEPITIASSLASNTIAVAYQTVVGLKVWILDLERQKRTYEGDITMSADAMLTWMYFGPNDILLAVDSNNIMRALTRSFDWAWTPVLDLCAGVVSFLEQEQESMHLSHTAIENHGVRPICFDYVEGYDPALMTLILKSGEEHPSCAERPALTPIPLQIPALDVAFEETTDAGPKMSFGAEEEAILRKDIMYQMGDRTNTAAMAQKFKKERVKASVVLFQRACDMNRQHLAFDIARLYLTSKKALLAAVRIATHVSLNQLAEKINGLLRTREAERMERMERDAMEKERLLMDLNGGSPYPSRDVSPPQRAPSELESKSNSPSADPPGAESMESKNEKSSAAHSQSRSNTFSFGNASAAGRTRNRKKRRLEDPNQPSAKRHQAMPFATSSNPAGKKQGGSLFDL